MPSCTFTYSPVRSILGNLTLLHSKNLHFSANIIFIPNEVFIAKKSKFLFLLEFTD